MPSFSKISQKRLDTCHQDIQTIFHYVIKVFDCTIVCGHRGEIDQNRAYDEGKSQLTFPKSKHNKTPSMAVDVVPYPIEWKNTNRMRYFAGRVMGIADMLKKYDAIEHTLRWGGDWDRDTELKDNRFNDMPHFELVKKIKV